MAGFPRRRTAPSCQKKKKKEGKKPYCRNRSHKRGKGKFEKNHRWHGNCKKGEIRKGNTAWQGDKTFKKGFLTY